MALLNKLKSLLGLDEGRSSGDQRKDDTVGVTVEHDRSDDQGPAPESDAEEPPITSTADAEPTEPESTEVEAETSGSVDEDAATDPEEAPPGTDAPGTEMAEPEPAETGDASEDGAGVDGTVDVEPDVDSPQPEGGAESESGSAVDADAETDQQTEPEPAPDSDADAGTGAEPEIGDSASAEDGSADEALRDIKGIGPSYETKLSEAGVETVDQLASADVDDLADDTGLSTKRVQRWIDRARSR